MKEKILFQVFFIAAANCLSPTFSFTQSVWTVKNPFEHKVFIENKGPFNEQNNLPAAQTEQIRYAVRQEGVEIYFTDQGVTYRHDEIEKLPEGEKESEEMEQEGKSPKIIPHLVSLKWLGSNPQAQIVAENPVSYYFTYSNLNDKTGKSGIKASAYKKIIYKNIYPNIDVEYVFPEDKEGIKYSIILHPGADPSAIKMSYTGAGTIKKDKEGNVIIPSPFGDFIDHAPQSFYEDDKTNIPSSFEIKENTISFKLLSPISKLQTIIIDPWITVPTFSGSYNRAYDVDYDYQGNVYIYGGDYLFQEIKLDNTGVIQWVFTTNAFTVSSAYENHFYGDFAVDGSSGTSYIVEGVRVAGSKVIKLDAGGIQTGLFAGDVRLQEMWRIVYNNCTKQAVIGGGIFSRSYQACILDTNLTNMTPVNVLSASDNAHDICLLALDDSNNCYMATVKSVLNGTFNNVLLKCPANTLSPPAWMVSDNHAFNEVGSITYVTSGCCQAKTNAMNGMAVSPKYLYTYDGKLIQRWNKNTGMLINSATISSTAFGWGGIAVDDCDNIFAGVQSSVIRYDTNFTVVSTIVTSNTVYDVRLGINNLLYACGNQFVSSFQLSGITCNTLNLTTSAVNIPCSLLNSATANINGGTGPYTYLWMPTGQATQTATGLSAGTYTLTVTDNSCVPKSQTDTIVITSPPPIAFTTTSVASCSGTSTGSATVNVSGGVSPYTYSWSPPSVAQTTAAASNLSSGTYTVTVTDTNGCSQTQTLSVAQLPLPIVTATASSNKIIVGDSTQLTGSGGIAYQWSPSTGLNDPAISNPVATPVQTTAYCVAVTDTNNCSNTDCVTIETIDPEPDCSIAGELYLPNAFSPNDDGENDVLQIYYGNFLCIKEFRIVIFDRWGERIFQSYDPAFKWEGTYRGKRLDSAVFVYYLKATFINEEKINKKGSISLLR